MRGHIEQRFSLSPDGDWPGALKPPFSAVFQHIQKETGQIATELPCTPNNSYHNGCQCHRIDLSAQPSLRKRYKTHKIPEIRRKLGFKLARSTYTQAGEISPRTTLGITANAALVSPRMTPAITGVHGSRHRTTLQVRDT